MKKVVRSFIFLFCVFFGVTIFASDLNLYENPDAKSKVIATIKSGEQLMPIFSPEKSEWVKVANPKDGSVGWIKSEDLKGPAITIITSTGGEKSPQVYKVVQLGGTEQIKSEEVDKVLKEMQVREQKMRESMSEMQESMQKMMQDMMKDFDSLGIGFSNEKKPDEKK